MAIWMLGISGGPPYFQAMIWLDGGDLVSIAEVGELVGVDRPGLPVLGDLFYSHRLYTDMQRDGSSSSRLSCFRSISVT